MTSKKLFFSASFLAIATANALACTSLIAGKKATVDGSVMITYAADSHVRFGFLEHQLTADHKPGDMRQIIDWTSNKHLGEIPEVEHTYGTIGNMNEYGLTISESTWGGRPELKGPNGILDYGSLMFIALQRAQTAREAIQVMTQLVDQYGYYSTGESFSIADENEAWIMEMIGKGADQKGAVWVAMRVPDDCISGHANHSRIHQFPLNDPKNCLYSPDVISFAREKGWFKGKDKDFSFSLAYAQYKYSSLRGCDARVWAFYNKFANGMEQYIPWITEGDGNPLPLWVKPNRKLTADDLKWMMRDHFEDTPFDMTKDIGAGPFKVPYRWRPSTFEVDGKSYYQERAIATQQTGFSFVAEINADRPETLKGLLWFGTDDANTCVYLPIFCTVERPPFELERNNGDLYHISWDSNFWVNNYVANQAYNRYNQMIPDIRKVQKSLEDSIAIDVQVAFDQLPEFEETDQRLLVQDLADIWANKATTQYKKLGDYLLVKFLDGNIKVEDENGFVSTEDNKPVPPVFGGYDDKYFRSIVNDSGDRLRVRKLKVKQLPLPQAAKQPAKTQQQPVQQQ